VNIPRSVQISLDALIDIAINSKSGIPVAIREVAKRQKVSLSYLEELIGALKSANLVQSIKGRKGGYLLASSLEQISVRDVILALNPIRKRKIDLTSMAKEFLQTLEDYTRDYFSNAASVAASMAAHPDESNLKPAQAESAYERLYESNSKIKSKVEVQRVFITKYAPLENTLAIGPNSVFNFGQYLTRTSKF
jgi:Rrf2 family iron-sulfur cluster assembly transcriptional regulator